MRHAPARSKTKKAKLVRGGGTLSFSYIFFLNLSTEGVEKQSKKTPRQRTTTTTRPRPKDPDYSLRYSPPFLFPMRERESAREREKKRRESGRQKSFILSPSLFLSLSDGGLDVLGPGDEDGIDREDGGVAGVDVCWLAKGGERKRERGEKEGNKIFFVYFLFSLFEAKSSPRRDRKTHRRPRGRPASRRSSPASG